MILVNEIYGPVTQGEGKSAGMDCMFLRLSGCNLSCIWCDSILKGTLVRSSDNKWLPIEQVQPGTKILGVEKEKNHKLQNRYFYKEASSNHLVSHKEIDAIKLILSNGVDITSTLNHQFFVSRRNSRSSYTVNWKWQWVEAKDLKVGDKLWSIGKPVLVEETQDFVSGWLTGFTLGDGWIDSKLREGQWDTITPEIKNRVVSYLKKKGYNPAVYEFSYTTKKLKLQRVGFAVRARNYTNEFLDSKEWERGLISGFFDAEGSNNTTQPILTNKKLTLLEQIRLILINLGYDTRIDPDIDGTYDLTVSCNLAKRLEFDAYFDYAKPHYRKWMWNEPGIRGGKSKHTKKLGKEIVTIQNIEILSGEFEFYDINSSTGNFFANGVLVHNTPYTWNWKGTKFQHPDKYDKTKEVHKMDYQDVMLKISKKSKDVNKLVISGGEPMLQQKVLLPLLNLLKADHWWVEVETNGTIIPLPLFTDLVNQYNCSPKTSNSGEENTLRMRVRPEVLRKLSSCGKGTFKFVVQSDLDMPEILSIMAVGDIHPNQVWLMAEGKTQEEQIQKQEAVERIAEAYRFHFSPRLHVLQYSNKRGV